MSNRYAIEGQTAAGTNLTILQLVGVSTRRGWIEYFCISSDASPADVTTEFNLIRGTVSGTGTAVTPRALDSGDPAAILSGERGTFTGQTKTSNSAMWNGAVHQRSLAQVYAVPGGEWVVPATSDNWVGIESINSGGTPNTNATIIYRE
jgi:hypothetical protein